MATSKVLEIIVKATDQASKQFDAISENSKKLSESLKDVKKYSWIATTALVWLWAVMVKQATDIEPVRNAFDNLTQTVGESSDAMLKSLKEASKWAVSEYDLMLSANRSMKLWVAQNTEDMTDLMKIARLYGQQMWQDVTQSFNDIVTWLWRGSPMILDNLWIIIDSEKAYEDYAKQLWKSSKELTKSEKTQALVNATLVEWRKALDEFGEPLPTMAEKFQKLKNSITETWTKIWSALLPVIQKILDAVQPIIDKLADWIDKNPELASKILLVTTAVSWLIFVMSSLPWIVSSISSGLSFLMSPIWLIIAWIAALALARATDFWWIREKTAEIVWKISDIIKPRLDKIKAFWEEHGEEIMTALSVLRDAVENIFKAWLDIIGWILEWAFQTIDIIMKIFTWDREWAWNGIVDLTRNTRETIQQVTEDLFWPLLDWIADKLTQARNRITEKVTAIKDSVIGIFQALREWLKLWFEFWIALFTGDWERVSEIWNTMAQAIDTALTNAFWQMRENIKGKFREWIDTVLGWVESFVGAIEWVVERIKNAWSNVKSAAQSVVSSAKSKYDSAVASLKSLVSWWRASGWPVSMWNAYLVWEKWPELFVPRQSWTIIPNHEITNNNWITINISWVSVRNENDIQELAREMVRQIKLEKNFGIA